MIIRPFHPDDESAVVALWERAEQLLLAFGCPKINVQIRSDNSAAIAFYERMGFAQDDVLSFGKRLIADEDSSGRQYCK